MIAITGELTIAYDTDEEKTRILNEVTANAAQLTLTAQDDVAKTITVSIDTGG